MRLVVLCLMRLSLVAGLTRSLAPRARCLGRRGGLVRAAGSEASSADVPDEGRTKQSRTREDRLNVGKAKAVARHARVCDASQRRVSPATATLRESAL